MTSRFALQAAGLLAIPALVIFTPLHAATADPTEGSNGGRRLFEKETFGGNGRTCRTCHSAATGTVSPDDAQARFTANPNDALFVGDGSDDGAGNGVSRMLLDATVLMRVPLAPNVEIDGRPADRFVTLRRGIPTTLNTPALDPVLMYDGRQPDLPSQALGAIREHAQPTKPPTAMELQKIAQFELTDTFFSSDALRTFARTGIPPALPQGTNDTERRGRRFFEDVQPDATNRGLCATCHSGPMLNETNDFVQSPPFRRGSRFQNILVSNFNAANNPVLVFNIHNSNGTVTTVTSPDPGRTLITGNDADANLFKIPTLWGVARTAPYFHDNSAKTLEDVMRHYQAFFLSGGNTVVLSQQDMSDITAFLNLLK